MATVFPSIATLVPGYLNLFLLLSMTVIEFVKLSSVKNGERMLRKNEIQGRYKSASTLSHYLS
jgi:hypothetical protein